MSGVAPRIVIADDHQGIRLGVRMALTRGGFDVVGEAGDGEGAVEVTLRELPDICLLDVCMPGGGVEAAAAIAAGAPATFVVMLTVSNDIDDVLASLRAGAVGYLPKDTHPDRLPAALCGVLRGEAALPRVLVGLVLEQLRDFDAVATYPVRVGGVEFDTPRVRDLPNARLGHDDAPGRQDPLALADHRSPPRLLRRCEARCDRPRRSASYDRPTDRRVTSPAPGRPTVSMTDASRVSRAYAHARRCACRMAVLQTGRRTSAACR